MTGPLTRRSDRARVPGARQSDSTREPGERGLAGARNTALREGRGDFFALLDSDDTWDPNFSRHRWPSSPATRRRPRFRSARFLGGPKDGEPARPCLPGAPVRRSSSDQRRGGCFIMTTFRLEVVDTIGVFDASKRRSEDWDFWLRAVSAGFVFRRNWTPLAAYRVREGACSRDKPAMLQEMLHTLSKVRAHCQPVVRRMSRLRHRSAGSSERCAGAREGGARGWPLPRRGREAAAASAHRGGALVESQPGSRSTHRPRRWPPTACEPPAPLAAA